MKEKLSNTKPKLTVARFIGKALAAGIVFIMISFVCTLIIGVLKFFIRMILA